MQVAAIGSDSATGATSGSAGNAATNAFGLSFDALLKIILTQLTYQDPLKPMDNFEFVSQLAQFSQVQQGQAANDKLEALVSAQATGQATGLLGTTVDVTTSTGTTISGKVTTVAFQSGTPSVTIETPGGQTISNIAISSISQLRVED